MTTPSQLLVDCHARGIRLSLAGDGGLTIDAPRAALTPDLIDRLRKPARASCCPSCGPL